MSNTHEALRMADSLDALSSPDNKSLTKMWARDGDAKTAALLRTQHALIVQMAKALEKLACLGNGDQPGNSTGNVIAQQALAPATQYLKGQQ
jgi:hypothetical protein